MLIKKRNNILISKIEPIGNPGINLLDADRPEQKIDGIIELPLRKACKLFRKKGIETVMSSANKNNLTKPGEKPKEKEDVSGKSQHLFLDAPTFEDAGVGYAWIMLNFDTLSDDNKDMLFSLEERVGPNGEKIGERGIWFVHPFMMGNLSYDLKTGKLDYEYLKTILTEDEMPPKIEKDERLAKFEAKSIILSYNDRYPADVVMIRMPINESTTVAEVEDYFYKFAEALKQQSIKREMQL